MKLLRTVLLLLISFSSRAFAACSIPAGNEGDVLYSSTYHVMQYCNGSSWIAMGSLPSPSYGTLTTNDFCIASNSTTIACNTASTGTGSVVLSASPTLSGTITGGTFSGTHTGDGSGLTNIGTASLGGITGSPSSTTYLAGDGTWSTPSGGGATIPSGAVIAFNLASCPSGWSALASAVGRPIIGVGTYPANSDADGSNASTTYTLAGTGGNEDITLSTGQLPPHSHTVTDTYPGGSTSNGILFQSGIGAKTVNGGSTVQTTSSVGSRTAIDIRPPYLVLLYCQKN